MNIHTAAIVMASFLYLCGILAVVAAIFNWEWFFRSTNVRMLTFGIRRRWQRLLYALFGAAMIAMAIRLTLDALWHNTP